MALSVQYLGSGGSTVSVTVPSGTQWLLALVSTINTGGTCTWNTSESMTSHGNSGYGGYNCIVFKLASPTAATANVVFSAGSMHVAVYAVTGADSTTPFRAVSYADESPGTALSVSPTSAVGDVVLGWHSGGNGVTWDGSVTVDWTQASGDPMASGGHKAGAATSTTMNFTNVNHNHAIMAFAVVPGGTDWYGSGDDAAIATESGAAWEDLYGSGSAAAIGTESGSAWEDLRGRGADAALGAEAGDPILDIAARGGAVAIATESGEPLQPEDTGTLPVDVPQRFSAYSAEHEKRFTWTLAPLNDDPAWTLAGCIVDLIVPGYDPLRCTVLDETLRVVTYVLIPGTLAPTRYTATLRISSGLRPAFETFPFLVDVALQ